MLISGDTQEHTTTASKNRELPKPGREDSLSWALLSGTLSSAMDTSASNFREGHQYKNCQNSLLCIISLSTVQQSHSENHRIVLGRKES